MRPDQLFPCRTSHPDPVGAYAPRPAFSLQNQSPRPSGRICAQTTLFLAEPVTQTQWAHMRPDQLFPCRTSHPDPVGAYAPRPAFSLQNQSPRPSGRICAQTSFFLAEPVTQTQWAHMRPDHPFPCRTSHPDPVGAYAPRPPFSLQNQSPRPSGRICTQATFFLAEPVTQTQWAHMHP